ncbi:Scr1 family TA system antitoxin-like transcriptional regulator [Streptomyces sp. NPDC058442]|uniref:Scr1 family TA system antitoxin-like transcriptional regulator n=1 Tax=Streptomyces sp. NPDC058442 TaxID=3346503 RepID=UPI0036479C4F
MTTSRHTHDGARPFPSGTAGAAVSAPYVQDGRRHDLRPPALSTADFGFVLEESVLMRHPGGESVTRELLDHLLACTEPGNVELQIMPLRQPHHAGPDGPVRLLETPGRQWCGYAERQRTGQLMSDREAVSVMWTRYARTRSQALSPADSAELSQRMRGVL